jgi:hypothetical protein
MAAERSPRRAGTWRYRARVVRWLRADVGFLESAPLRALTDHARRVVYFDFDRAMERWDLERDPAIRDEARHIIERREAEERREKPRGGPISGRGSRTS